MGAGQPELFTQELDEKRAVLDIGGDGITVHDQGNLGHQHSLELHRRMSAAQTLKSFQSHNMGHPDNEQPGSPSTLSGACLST